MVRFSVLFTIVGFAHLSICASPPLRGPPQFEKNPQFSNSYLPASMQIIAYLTELMKYDLRPQTGTTTTTSRPTPAHRPGLYAPSVPLGPSVYFAQKSPYEEYVQRFEVLKNDDDKSIWSENLGAITKIMEQLEPGLQQSAMNDLELLGQGPNNLHMLVNGLDDDYTGDDEDLRVRKFSETFDDSSPSELLKQKKTPPTRAYVTLLSLYDLLNKESKKIGLNKFNGYSHRVLNDLIETATGTSSYQLKHVLSKILDQHDTRDQAITNKIKTLLTDLGQDDSYINVALRYIPPLPFEP